MVMARSVAPRDEEHDFVEQPSRDFFCPVTFDVLLEPYLTECCGHHLSETAYRQLQAQGKPCPVCKEEPLKAVKDKYHKRRVSSLKVRCPHKAEVCEWQGELGSLEKHLNANSSAGECRYVDVDCPYACGERVQRRSLEEHKSQRCSLRPFTCQYCNHKATHQKITKEHWPVCEKYPLPCPNKCGVNMFERQHLKGHLEQTCPLEEIQCDFSYAGCGAQLQRCLMSAHVKEGMEAHLSLLAQKVPKLEDKIKQQGDKIEQQVDLIKQQGEQMKQQGDQIKQQGDQMKQQGDQIKQQGDQMKQQGDQIKQQGDQIKELIDGLGRQDKVLKVLCRTTSQAVPPVEFTVENIQKLRVNNDTWYSPPFYSHLGGYKMRLRVESNFVVLNISVCLMKGEFDDDLSWPLEGTLTLEQPLKTKVELRASKPKEGEILSLSIFWHEAPDLTLCVSEVSVKL